jgi:hypothetical protein
MITANQRIFLYLKKIYKTDNLVYVHSRCTAMVHWVRVALVCTNHIRINQINTVLLAISGLKMLPYKLQLLKFQLNTHAIGDSANTVILKIYSKAWLEPRPKMEGEHAKF